MEPFIVPKIVWSSIVKNKMNARKKVCLGNEIRREDLFFAADEG
jgi:hypothetical protein